LKSFRIVETFEHRLRTLRETLARIDGPTIVCAQAGNVNTGSFDPLREIATATRERAGAQTRKLTPPEMSSAPTVRRRWGCIRRCPLQELHRASAKPGTAFLRRFPKYKAWSHFASNSGRLLPIADVATPNWAFTEYGVPLIVHVN
jgi:hypothetical protein